MTVYSTAVAIADAIIITIATIYCHYVVGGGVARGREGGGARETESERECVGG